MLGLRHLATDANIGGGALISSHRISGTKKLKSAVEIERPREIEDENGLSQVCHEMETVTEWTEMVVKPPGDKAHLYW